MAGLMKATFIVQALESVGDNSAGFTFDSNSKASKFASAVQSFAQSQWRKLNGLEGGRGNKEAKHMEYGLPIQIVAQRVDDNGNEVGDAFVLDELTDEK